MSAPKLSFNLFSELENKLRRELEKFHKGHKVSVLSIYFMEDSPKLDHVLVFYMVSGLTNRFCLTVKKGKIIIERTADNNPLEWEKIYSG